MTTTNMTGAELQTLRESLHMDRDDLAGLAGVQARTVKHWENGRAGVPADVASLVQGMAQQVDAGAAALVTNLLLFNALQAAPAQMALVRFHAEDYPQRMRHFHQTCGLNSDAIAIIEGRHLATHEAIIARTCATLQHTGRAPRVVWFDAESWHAWRTSHPTAPGWEWAQSLVASQALPHRQDQPPAQD